MKQPTTTEEFFALPIVPFGTVGDAIAWSRDGIMQAQDLEGVVWALVLTNGAYARKVA